MGQTLIKSARLSIALLCILLLVSCGAKIQPVPKTLSASLNIKTVNIKFHPKAKINWWKAEKEYAEANGISLEKENPNNPEEYQDLMKIPEVKAHVQNKLKVSLNKHLSETLKQKFNGTRPVILEVTIMSFDIPSPGRRILLGGAPRINAITIVKDAKSRTELVKFDRIVSAYAGSGVVGVLVDQAFDDLHIRVIRDYTNTMYNWLSGNLN